jgi:hypothetical protein
VRRHMTREKTDTVLKVLVKHFFIEKEVASTLVIDSLYSGLKALEYQSKNKKGPSKLTESDARSTPMVFIDQDMFVLADDVIALLERAALDTLPHQPLPMKDDKSSQNRTKVCMFLLLALIRVTSIIEKLILWKFPCLLKLKSFFFRVCFHAVPAFLRFLSILKCKITLR